MDPSLPFRPAGPTVIISATTNAPSGTLPAGPNSGDVDYLVFNRTGVDSWLGYGPTSDVAVSNSVIPIVGTASAALPCPSGTVQVFTLAPNQFFAARTATGLSSISVTPGYGN